MFLKEALAQVFLCKFHKIFQKCFVVLKKPFWEPLQRFASEIAKFQATSSLFLKESVVFNFLNIKNKTWYFLIHPPLISPLFQKKTK